MKSQHSMIRLFFLLALLHGVYSLSAQDEPKKKPLIVSSASIFADMVSAIGGDLVESVSIVPIGGDPHIYEPTPGDVIKLTKADLILQNGLTFEGWISNLIKNSGAKAPVVTLTEGIIPITSEQHQNATDPHAWMDPVNGKVYAHNIKNALLKLLPDHWEQINVQFESYMDQLFALDQYVRENISRIDSSKRILITSHDSFRYLSRRYGLRVESVLGTSTDADVRTSDMIRLNEVIRENKIPVVFIESTINPKLMNQLAEDNHVRIGGKLYSDSLGDKDSPANTYLNMIRHNINTIVSGLTSSASLAEEKKSGNRVGLVMLGGIGLIMMATLLYFMKKRMNVSL